jgi:hypothetical protein
MQLCARCMQVLPKGAKKAATLLAKAEKCVP